MITRRKLLMSAAPVAGALALAGCASINSTTISSLTSEVLGYVQQAVAAVANYVPTVESIAALAASLFGPEWVAVVQVGSTAINELIAALQNVATQVPVSARRRLMARLRMSSPVSPVVIGVVNGVAIQGYH